jgi:ABC-type multidrug transport system fused ATPase/permease subunit
MKDGRVVEMGKHEELLNLDGVYAGLYKAQF